MSRASPRPGPIPPGRDRPPPEQPGGSTGKFHRGKPMGRIPGHLRTPSPPKGWDKPCPLPRDPPQPLQGSLRNHLSLSRDLSGTTSAPPGIPWDSPHCTQGSPRYHPSPAQRSLGTLLSSSRDPSGPSSVPPGIPQESSQPPHGSLGTPQPLQGPLTSPFPNSFLRAEASLGPSKNLSGAPKPPSRSLPSAPPHRAAAASPPWPPSRRLPAGCGRSFYSSPPPPYPRRSACTPSRRRGRPGGRRRGGWNRDWDRDRGRKRERGRDRGRSCLGPGGS